MRFKCPKCKTRQEQDVNGNASVQCSNCQLTIKIKHSDSAIKDSAEVDQVLQNGGVDSATSSEPPASWVNFPAIDKYEINRGPLGYTVHYKCPNCQSRLNSPLRGAGGRDHCPDCRVFFIVPGEKDYHELEGKKAADDEKRRLEQEQKTEASKKAVVSRVAAQQRKNQHVQLNRDPMRDWLIYTSIILALVIFASGRYIVAAVITDQSRLSIVILALFFLGLIVNLRGMLRLRNEYVCAAVCMIGLRKPNGLNLQLTEPVAGVFHQHLIDLCNIAKHDKNFSQDSLITLLYSRMMADSKVVDVLSGVLVTLGLIGTIVGLIGMTNGLSDTLSSLDDSASAGLLTGMRATMSGLGTAFYTTLVGAILGSVFLRILNSVYTSNVDHLVTYVASTAEVSIIPRLKSRHEQGGQL